MFDILTALSSGHASWGNFALLLFLFGCLPSLLNHLKSIMRIMFPHFPGIMRMFSPLLLSSSSAIRLAATTIAVAIILLATNVTIGNAQEKQLMSQSSAIENGTALSIEDSFRVHVPEDWVIHDVRNTGFTLVVEVLQGHGLLAQLCPEEHQQRQQSVITKARGGQYIHQQQ